MEEVVVEKTKKWIQEFVLDLNLCPFAKASFVNNKILFEVDNSRDIESRILSFKQLIDGLIVQSNQSNAFLLFPFGLTKFDEFLEVFHLCEFLLETEHLDEIFQIVSFHPDYLYQGYEPTNPVNFTNRSPYPMIHILRTEEVENAMNGYPMSLEEILENNKETLRIKFKK